jgi:hypothetical protein
MHKSRYLKIFTFLLFKRENKFELSLEKAI